MQRAEQRTQLLDKAEQLKAEWNTSTLVTPTVNWFEENQSRLRPRKGAMLIRHFKGRDGKSGRRMPRRGRETYSPVVGNGRPGRLSAHWGRVENTEAGDQHLSQKSEGLSGIWHL
jgi:hypothetical protein